MVEEVEVVQVEVVEGEGKVDEDEVAGKVEALVDEEEAMEGMEVQVPVDNMGNCDLNSNKVNNRELRQRFGLLAPDRCR